MSKTRRKLSATVVDFHDELRRLRRYDAYNQARFSKPLGSPAITRRQLELMTEAIFFRGFRAYERFIRDVFLLYCLGKRPRSGKRVISYLSAKSFLHAEELIRSASKHVDWNNPEVVIKRAELYLKDGFPVKLPYVTHLQTLHDFRRIRNHIAHDSLDSLAQYQVTLRRHFGVVPLNIPAPGAFLLQSDAAVPGNYKLLSFFDVMEQLSTDIS